MAAAAGGGGGSRGRAPQRAAPGAVGNPRTNSPLLSNMRRFFGISRDNRAHHAGVSAEQRTTTARDPHAALRLSVKQQLLGGLKVAAHQLMEEKTRDSNGPVNPAARAHDFDAIKTSLLQILCHEVKADLGERASAKDRHALVSSRLWQFLNKVTPTAAKNIAEKNPEAPDFALCKRWVARSIRNPQLLRKAFAAVKHHDTYFAAAACIRDPDAAEAVFGYVNALCIFTTTDEQAVARCASELPRENSGEAQAATSAAAPAAETDEPLVYRHRQRRTRHHGDGCGSGEDEPGSLEEQVKEELLMSLHMPVRRQSSSQSEASISATSESPLPRATTVSPPAVTAPQAQELGASGSEGLPEGPNEAAVPVPTENDQQAGHQSDAVEGPTAAQEAHMLPTEDQVAYGSPKENPPPVKENQPPVSKEGAALSPRSPAERPQLTRAESTNEDFAAVFRRQLQLPDSPQGTPASEASTTAAVYAAKAERPSRFPASFERATEEVWENQRRILPVKSSFVPTKRPFDRFPWSDVSGGEERDPKTLQPPAGWEWDAGGWSKAVRDDTDADGWQYAPIFHVRATSFSKECDATSFVRRRRWTRVSVRTGKVDLTTVLAPAEQAGYEDSAPGTWKFESGRMSGTNKYQIGDISRIGIRRIGSAFRDLSEWFKPQVQPNPSASVYGEGDTATEARPQMVNDRLADSDDFVVLEYDDHLLRCMASDLTRAPTETEVPKGGLYCTNCNDPIPVVDPDNPLEFARWCAYTGEWYCHGCHHNDASIIPARVLATADFGSYPVCCKALEFLNLISTEPVFSSAMVSEDHTPKLDALRSKLMQLTRLRHAVQASVACVQQCTLTDQTKLTKLLWPREHLMQSDSMYCIQDIRELAVEMSPRPGQQVGPLEQRLLSVMKYCDSHLQACGQCRRRSAAVP